VSEQGVRLNIRKATLREWRREFARHLRDQGIAANATDRAVRGESRTHKTDAIYRASLRGESTHMRARAEAVASELIKGNLRVEAGKSNLMETRKQVERWWRATTDILLREGQAELAAKARRFVDQMRPALTDKERIAGELFERARELRVRAESMTR
jgi:hypothetical protein